MFETQSGGGQPFRKKRRYGFGDDDGTTPLPSNEYAALSQAMNDAPPEGVPQKRDFTLFQPVNAAALPPQMPQGVDNPPPPTDPALLQTSSALPENPQISTRPLAPLFEVKPVEKGGGGSDVTAGNQPLVTTLEPVQSNQPNQPNRMPAFEPLQPPATAPVTPMTELERKRARLAEIAAAPVEKQSAGKQALFMALQAVGNIFSGQGNKPIEWLGNAKKRVALEQAQREIAPLQALEDQRLQDEAKQAQIQSVKDRPLIARQQIQARLEQEMLRQKGRMEALNRQADIRSGEAKIVTDKDGLLWKRYLKPDSSGKLKPDEPVINPSTGEQDFAPGEQMVDWPDPQTGQTVKVKAKQVLMPDATIAQGNANREQTAATTNANNEIRVATENASNWLRYNGQLLDLASKTAQASGAVIENQAELEGINRSTQSAMQQLGELANRDTSQMTSAEIEKTNGRIQELTDQINANNIKFSTALGKTKAGQDALTQIGKTNISAPQKIVAPKIQAVKVGGKTATRATVEAFAKKKGISYEEAKRQAEADGYTVQ